MTVRELRQKYLAFFESKGHSMYPSGSLVPIDVTGRLDESLLFNGAGMVQFKPFFRGIAEPSNKRLTNAQKCVRTGDIDEVGDTTHLTFFEMMGNFSFGDYFKKGAIDYSWEFIVDPKWLGLDPRKLSVTVFESDEDAYQVWAEHFRSAGIDPETRVFRLGEETNYWPAGAFTNGPPGPCGPNTEMFYWVSPDDIPPVEGGAQSYSRDRWIQDEADKKWIEFWNDVFIQYEWQGEARPEGGYAKTGMPLLPFQSVDTGMGLERAATVLGGYQCIYDTDVFQPVFRRLESLAQPSGSLAYGDDPGKDVAMRIIADHLRAASFCIADGILPSNTGRGYVLRRLIRRAVLKGQRALGFSDPFAHLVLDGIIEAMGDHYVELHMRREVIVETLKNEESQFRRTLREGLEVFFEFFITEFSDQLKAAFPDAFTEPRNARMRLTRLFEEGRLRFSQDSNLPKFDGAQAYTLYDTYGFPLEVTKELCDEAGVEVDLQGYDRALIEAQERSRGADSRESVYGGVVINVLFASDGDESPTPTVFRGYSSTQTKSLIVGAVPMANLEGTASAEFAVALDETPFYAESGGQVSDSGWLLPQSNLPKLRVVDVSKQDGVFVHLVEPSESLGHEGLPLDQASRMLNEKLFKQAVEAHVDADRRAAITRNHTATHLLHAALRGALGNHVAQAGSLVSPEHLRFDFTHGKALSPQELHEVEQTVNLEVLKAQPMKIYEDVPLDEARKMGAMALFGEKYADFVRVVQVGGMMNDEPSYSRELCGGIHVRNTGEIGLFKILHEASAASGVRRIEAVTGLGAYDWVLRQESTLLSASERLKTNPRELTAAIEKTLEALRDERKKREKLAQQGAGGQSSEEHIGSVRLVVEKLQGADPKDAQARADRIVDQGPDKVALIANLADEKLLFVVKAGTAAVAAGTHAGNIVKAVAQHAGGGGGGRPDFATAGGKDVSKMDEAVEAGIRLLRSQLGV